MTKAKEVAKAILGAACMTTGVIVVVDVWHYWGLVVGGTLVAFSYVWLWYRGR